MDWERGGGHLQRTTSTKHVILVWDQSFTSLIVLVQYELFVIFSLFQDCSISCSSQSYAKIFNLPGGGNFTGPQV